MLKFVKLCFAKGFTQNDTCGNHVHIKVNDKIMGLFSYFKFFKTFEKEYVKFALSRLDSDKYLERLSNSYCRSFYSELTIKRQLTEYKKSSARYTMINLNSYNLHGTIEFRVLPHFDSYREAKESILWLYNTVKKILKKKNWLLNETKIRIIKHRIKSAKIKVIKLV